MACECKNNYTYEDYLVEFAKDEEGLKKCNKCPNLEYNDGIATCEKFNDIEDL